MGYSKERFKISGGGVLITWKILNSPAYKDLTSSAAKCLPFFLGKVKFGKKTGIVYDSSSYYKAEFHFPYSEAKRYGFSSSTYSGIIKELVRKGFVDPVVRGGLKGVALSYSWFRLSARWKNYKTPDFIEIKWETLVPKPRKKKKGHAYPFHSPSDQSYSFSTPNSETNSSTIRNMEPPSNPSISESGAVGRTVA